MPFYTIWYGVFHRSTRRLVFASGGHPPGLLVSRRDGDVVVERGGGAALPIGMLPVAPFANAEIDVPLDSNLSLFSDGAYEITQPDGNMWTLDAFAETLRASDPASGLANLDEVESTIRRIRGQADFEDDVSILGVRFGR